jgi:hypothetical protein
MFLTILVYEIQNFVTGRNSAGLCAASTVVLSHSTCSEASLVTHSDHNYKCCDLDPFASLNRHVVRSMGETKISIIFSGVLILRTVPLFSVGTLVIPLYLQTVHRLSE